MKETNLLFFKPIQDVSIIKEGTWKLAVMQRLWSNKVEQCLPHIQEHYRPRFNKVNF